MADRQSAVFRDLKIFSLCAVSVALIACSQPQTDGKTVEVQAQSRPNFLLIVADDLGYADLGVFGGEINTPNLDALARQGIQLTHFHTATNCSPTRAMMMTGMDNHLVGLGNMAERMRLGAPELMQHPGYEGYLNFRAPTLPELLRQGGYRTYMSGKWHLGLEDHTSPHARGFDRSYVMLEGAAGHLDDRQVMPGTGRDAILFREDGQLTTIPEDFYSTRNFAGKMIDYLRAHDAEQAGNPFFAYLAFTAPHWPLQVPEGSMGKYAGHYDEGYDVLFERRLSRQKELGLIDENVAGQPPVNGAEPWDRLSDAERRYSARLMEIYAAMVDDMDVYIGQVIDVLKQTGQFENTVVLFMSDNGAEGGEQNRHPAMQAYIEENFDNTYENMGHASSYLMYGREWARVSSVPSRLFKSHTTQGGVLSPAILSYPGAQQAGVYPHFVSAMDILPTFLAMANVNHPSHTEQGGELLPLQGASFASIFQDQTQPIHGSDYVMGWEMSNRRAIRRGAWKLVANGPPFGDDQWRLHDLSIDPSESRDLSAERPELVTELLAEWQFYVARNGVVVPKRQQAPETGG